MAVCDGYQTVDSYAGLEAPFTRASLGQDVNHPGRIHEIGRPLQPVCLTNKRKFRVIGPIDWSDLERSGYTWPRSSWTLRIT
jgi:hypothetical protein